ncbi:unnamed protein product [Cercopithifilaria johnstoni]|uniref:Uncharacterized protein n=1 Tax=Cercopithifilaria johnstoni TaxID=2874296 RepID=A0A8J2PVM5_9BILA|nr:unnamed protein product [Cercopithifilaria johnstoni]
MERSDVMKTTGKCGRYAYRAVHHFKKYAEKCIELGIPVPFAAEMTRNASQLLKDLGLEAKTKLCHCFRCNLDLTSTKTVSFRLSVRKRRMKKNKWKGYRRPTHLIAVCKGCGAEMKGGALATVDYEKQGMQTSFDQRLRRESRGFSGQSTFSTPETSLPRTPISSQIAEKKISSSARRRKMASKLQLLLSSQTPTRKDTSLQGFLEAFKINTK